MKIVSCIVIVFFSFVAALAQDKSTKIEAAKVAFVKEKIQLTENQEMLFWPIYNDYLDKKQEIRKQIKSLKTETGALSATDEQLKFDLQKLFDLRQQELMLEKEYFTNKFIKVISLRQVVELQKAEKQFTLMLIKKLEEAK